MAVHTTVDSVWVIRKSSMQQLEAFYVLCLIAEPCASSALTTHLRSALVLEDPRRSASSSESRP